MLRELKKNVNITIDMKNIQYIFGAYNEQICLCHVRVNVGFVDGHFKL